MKTLFFPTRKGGVRYFKDPVKVDTDKNTVESVDAIPLDFSNIYFISVINRSNTFNIGILTT